MDLAYFAKNSGSGYKDSSLLRPQTLLAVGTSLCFPEPRLCWEKDPVNLFCLSEGQGDPVR